MASYYRTFADIKMLDLFDGRLDTDEDQRVIALWSNPNEGYLTDGKGGSMRVTGRGYVRHFEGYCESIVRRICEVFETSFHQEGEPEYYGFKNLEEMERYEQETQAKQQAAEQERKQQLYHNVINFLRFKNHSLEAKGHNMDLALKAHQLVTGDPTLLETSRHSELFFEAERLLAEEKEREASCPF